ncbi:transposase from transposon Tn916 [bacterium BMS3Bbin04]|nr:transposase from transposon Tn916 [bacterium BMS3Bbin04]
MRIQGHPTQYATFDRLTDAKQWANQNDADLKAGRHLPTVESKRHTLADLIERYENTVLLHKKDPRNQQRQLKWWRERYGKRLLSDITPALITEARDTLREGERSDSTVNRYMAALSHPFTVASKEWQWIETNPVLRVSKLKEPRGRVRYLSDDERNRLLAACKVSKNPDLLLSVILALSTGARKAEIWGSKWEQVDFARELIVLHETKNQERRVLPIKGRALELLRDRSKVRSLETDLIFPSKKDPKRPMDLRAPWELALNQAQIEDFRWHDLRHSAASYLAMSGATPGEIAAVLGHKTLQMVKRYAHLSEAHTASVVEKMNKLFISGNA